MPRRRSFQLNPAVLLTPALWPKTGSPPIDLAIANGARALGSHVLAQMNPQVAALAGALADAVRENAARPAAVALSNPIITTIPNGGSTLGNDKPKFMRGLAEMKSGVISIIGKKGSGKSVLSFKLGEMWKRQGRKVYVVGVSAVLLKRFGFLELSPDDVDTIPANSIIIIDDAGLSFGQLDGASSSSKRLQKFLIITRHKSSILVWNNIMSRLVSWALLDSDVFFVKPRSRIGAKQERPELQEILEEADAAFKGMTPEEQQQHAYAYSDPLNYSGLISYTPASGWNERVSRNKAGR